MSTLAEIPRDTDGIISHARELKAVEQLPENLMLLKMENESIMSVAKAQPREPAKIVAQLAELINAWPAAADDAIYSKPVGTVTSVVCGNKSCGIKYEVAKVSNETACPVCDSRQRGECRPVKKYAEGLSIRAAEAIRSIYGYTRMTVNCEILRDGSARLTGTLVDYAAGNMTSDERIVPRSYKSANGQITQIAEDRFLSVVVKAEKAKLRRDLILDNTPGIIKAMYRDMCEQKLVALVAPELIEQKIFPAFAHYGITPEHLDKIIGRPFKLGWSEEERLRLRGILAGLKNEEITVKEVLEGINTVDSPVLPTAKPAPQTTSELAEQLKNQQQQQQPQSTQPQQSGDSQQAPAGQATEQVQVDAAAVLAKFEEELAKCDTLSSVGKVQSEYAKQSLPKDLANAIADKADAARERIREDINRRKRS